MCYSYAFYCCFLIEEDGETVPGGQEYAEGKLLAAGFRFLVDQGFG